jgi:hypothetical protein
VTTGKWRDGSGRAPDRVPRTIAGQAAISALRASVKRAITPTIVAVEDEARGPLLAALGDANAVLKAVAALDPTESWDQAVRRDLVQRAVAAASSIESALEA